MKVEKKPIETLLVLGAGELGIQVLRALANKTQEHSHLKISVLLRSEAAHAISGSRKARLDELMKLGISVVEGDLHQNSIDELSEIFGSFDAVINCSGFVGGPGTQIKITQAVLKAAVDRYFPWQFGVDYDVIGKGSGQQVWDEQLDVHIFCVRRTRQSGSLSLRVFLPATCSNPALVSLMHRIKPFMAWVTGIMR